MPYSAEISRTNPSCFLFLIDQSGSMNDAFSGTNRKKAQAMADAVNKLLKELTLKCAKAEGVRDYYHVGVIGYGASVGPAFGGAIAGRELVPISDLANHPARLEDRTKKVEDGAGGIIDQTVKFPIWFDPKADNGTPMNAAFGIAERIIGGWLQEHPGSYPPIVINITDGESTDGDPAPAAERLKGMASGDGNVLLFNLHISASPGPPTEFPDSESALTDTFAQHLYRMSSLLPEKMRAIAEQEGFRVSEGTRGFVYNADLVRMIQFLDIGTRVGNLR
jgi:uncharacterized protein YegL